MEIPDSEDNAQARTNYQQSLDIEPSPIVGALPVC